MGGAEELYMYQWNLSELNGKAEWCETLISLSLPESFNGTALWQEIWAGSKNFTFYFLVLNFYDAFKKGVHSILIGAAAGCTAT
jgi:hypothetical protein